MELRMKTILIGSLSKHDVDESKNVIWKCNYISAIICQLFKVIMPENVF